MASEDIDPDENWVETATFTMPSYRAMQSRVIRNRTCRCGTAAVLRTSFSRENPARRFWSCSNDRGFRCDYRAWEDTELTKHYKDVLNAAFMRNHELTALIMRSRHNVMVCKFGLGVAAFLIVGLLLKACFV